MKSYDLTREKQELDVARQTHSLNVEFESAQLENFRHGVEELARAASPGGAGGAGNFVGRAASPGGQRIRAGSAEGAFFGGGATSFDDMGRPLSARDYAGRDGGLGGGGPPRAFPAPAFGSSAPARPGSPRVGAAPAPAAHQQRPASPRSSQRLNNSTNSNSSSSRAGPGPRHGQILNESSASTAGARGAASGPAGATRAAAGPFHAPVASPLGPSASVFPTQTPNESFTRKNPSPATGGVRGGQRLGATLIDRFGPQQMNNPNHFMIGDGGDIPNLADHEDFAEQRQLYEDVFPPGGGAGARSGPIIRNLLEEEGHVDMR